MAAYIALIRKERGTDYGVNFPDLPGLVTAGRTLAEALEFAREALAGHIEVMAEHGDPIPAPSDVDAIMRDRENRDAVAALVEAPVPKGRAVQVTITMDERLLAEVNRRAEAIGMTRSGLLAEGARRMIGTGARAPRRKGAPNRRRA